MRSTLSPEPAAVRAHEPKSVVPPSAAGAWLQRLTAPAVLYPLLVMITLGVLWFGTLHVSRVERESARRRTQATSQELLETYEAQVVRVIREIDQTLKGLRYVYEMSGDGATVLDALAARDLLPPQIVFAVSLTNVQGDIIATTRDPAVPVVMSRDFFERARVSADIIEGRPVLYGDEHWLPFGRALLKPDGSFGGVALVEVDASLFVSGYEEAKLGVHGVVALVGRDGTFRVRRSGERVTVGERVSWNDVVPYQEFGETTTVLAASPWDGVRRYTSARELYDLPLAVVAGLSESEQLARARQRARVYTMRALVASVLLVLGLAVLGRMNWKLEDMRRREREYRVAHAMRVEHLAYHDALTGLPNRSFMSKLLDERIRHASRFGREFALLFLDLDGFKQINDTLGHDAGDDLLREVAKRLEDALRRSDTVARMGGDEFMVLLPELDCAEQAATVARNILATLAEPFVLLGEKFNVTVSVGISIFPFDGEDEQTLMKNADIAMYAAKDGGKNSFRFFAAAMSSASQERINLEAGLRRALVNEEFELHYQARRDLRTDTVTGMEALLRWNHPELGMIGPNKFLPLAEDTGLIIPIGRWVLRTACRQNLAWLEQGLPRLHVAVNLSARQFFDRRLVEDVAAVLQETGMPPALLELEISESVLARDTRRTLPVLQHLKQLGVRITVDNFGTSYSALSVLGELPLDSIKIDRVFLREDSGNAAARDVINGILAMGRVLSPSVVAHGVETREQVEFLREQVCGQVQGFFFGRPFRAEDAVETLQAENLVLSGVATAEPVSG